ncbi:unnamed protein product [Coffea canephora]|uniref:Uncharacterized protein n=1 Tax=Coffea canephora TaxID=49390 RepID=A0A068UCJ6_COFCA|nr:unnamed protein product [Coffea canephora]
MTVAVPDKRQFVTFMSWSEIFRLNFGTITDQIVENANFCFFVWVNSLWQTVFINRIVFQFWARWTYCFEAYILGNRWFYT